jgi:hypothetical protein
MPVQFCSLKAFFASMSKNSSLLLVGATPKGVIAPWHEFRLQCQLQAQHRAGQYHKLLWPHCLQQEEEFWKLLTAKLHQRLVGKYLGTYLGQWVIQT